jgi:hypothetical protein
VANIILGGPLSGGACAGLSTAAKTIHAPKTTQTLESILGIFRLPVLIVPLPFSSH